MKKIMTIADSITTKITIAMCSLRALTEAPTQRRCTLTYKSW